MDPIVTQTDKGRMRQLIVTLVLAILMTAGLLFFVWYGSPESGTSTQVYWAFVAGLVILGINYINDNVLLELVQRFPIPSKFLPKG